MLHLQSHFWEVQLQVQHITSYFSTSIKKSLHFVVDSKLSNSLQLPEFHLKSDMDYPHEITAMNESLGFETWLVKSDKIDEYSFEFCSMMCQNAEPDDEHMNDVSEWFARIVAISTNLETRTMNQH